VRSIKRALSIDRSRNTAALRRCRESRCVEAAPWHKLLTRSAKLLTVVRASFLRHSSSTSQHFTSPKSVHARCESRLISTKTILSLKVAEQPPTLVPQPVKQSPRTRPLSTLLESRVDCDGSSPKTRVADQPPSRAFIEK
jgi:hypothetical protein